MGRRFHEDRYDKEVTAKYWYGAVPKWMRRMWYHRARQKARQEDQLTRIDPDTHLPTPSRYAGNWWEWY